jgi:hypothetical protein
MTWRPREIDKNPISVVALGATQTKKIQLPVVKQPETTQSGYPISEPLLKTVEKLKNPISIR